MPKARSSSSSSSKRSDTARKNERGRTYGAAAASAAKRRGVAVINHGAGTMPAAAPAPFGGERYTLLTDPPDAPPPRRVAPSAGERDAVTGRLVFAEAPAGFAPGLTPRQMLEKGVFGGCYFNPRGGKAGIFGRDVAVGTEEFPPAWFAGLPCERYAGRRYSAAAINCYGVKSGQDQKFWEMKGWLHARDPRGWFQWYCRFYHGRRCADDARQAKRWAACAGAKGRWRGQLCGRLVKSKAGRAARFDDATVSPVIRQTLLHWAYELTEADWEEWKATH